MDIREHLLRGLQNSVLSLQPFRDLKVLLSKKFNHKQSKGYALRVQTEPSLKAAATIPLTSLLRGTASGAFVLGVQTVHPGCMEKGVRVRARREPRLLPGAAGAPDSALGAPSRAEPNRSEAEPPWPRRAHPGLTPGAERRSGAGTPRALSALRGQRAPAICGPCGAGQVTPTPGEWVAKCPWSRFLQRNSGHPGHFPVNRSLVRRVSSAKLCPVLEFPGREVSAPLGREGVAFLRERITRP